MTKLVNQSVKLKDASEMKSQHDDNAGVERPHSRAVVVQLLSTKVGKCLALAVDTRHEHVEGHLRKSEEPVNLPRFVVREGFRLYKIPHVSEKVSVALALGWRREFAVIEGGSNPHVVHEGWEADHHAAHTNGAAELMQARSVLWREELFRLHLVVELDDLPFALCVSVCLAIAVSIRVAVGVSVSVCMSISVGVSVALLLGLLLHITLVRLERLQEVLWLRRRLVSIGCKRLALRLPASRGLDEARAIGLSGLCMSATNARICTARVCNLESTH